VIAQVARQRCLGEGLRRRPAHAGDAHTPHARFVPPHLLGRQRQHGTEQPVLRRADGELRRVDADGQPPGPGRQVVAAQGALAALVEPALGRQRQGQSGDGDAAVQGAAYFRW
jgi:hypothetical protein